MDSAADSVAAAAELVLRRFVIPILDAGVDFPSLLVARACGQRVFGPRAYKLGVRSRWEWGGVDYLLVRLRRSDTELSLPPGSPGRARAVLSALLRRPAKIYDVSAPGIAVTR